MRRCYEDCLDIAVKLVEEEWAFDDKQTEFAGPQEAAIFVDQVISQKRWRGPKRVWLQYTEARQVNGEEMKAWTDGSQVALGPGGRTKEAVLHELAHVLTWDTSAADHGWVWMRAYIGLAKRFLPAYGAFLERRLR
jgi:hypothetical protein